MTAQGFAIFNKKTDKFKYGVHWLDTFAQLFRFKKEAKKDMERLDDNENLVIVEFKSSELNYKWDAFKE